MQVAVRCLRARRALFMMLAFAASHAPAAHAQVVADPDFWKQTAERQDTVNRLIYSQSPQTIPPSYDPVREAEEILRQQQRTLPASKPEVPSLWRQVRTITVRSALSTAPRALGVIGLAAGTFELGWKMGSGINAKFLRIGLPDPPAPKTSPAQGTLVFKNQGFTSSLNNAPLPADGWLLHWWYGNSQYTSVNLSHGWGHACAYLTGPPADFNVLPGFATVGWCELPPVPVESYWLEENALEAAGPIEDYTGQPYTKSTGAPTPPPQATVEQSIENELAKPENGLLRQWLNYELGSPGERDPVGGGVNVPQPAVAPGEGAETFVEELEELGLTNIKVKVLSNPDFDPAYNEGAVVRVSPAPGTHVVPGTEIEVTANRTAERPNNGECDRGAHQELSLPPETTEFSLKDTFSGRDPDQGMAATDVPFRWGTLAWGYRHVVNEHGWDNDRDRSDTQAALYDPTPEPDDPGSHRFYFFYLGPNRIPCTRRVVARFDVLDGEPAKRGIITSFAHPGWYRKSDFP